MNLLFRYFEKKSQGFKPCKLRIGLRHTYERVYNNDVFGESHTWSNNEPFGLVDNLVDNIRYELGERFL